MKTLTSIFSFLILFICVEANAVEKSIHATRVIAAPKIDGLLDDSCWKSLPVAADFITNDPVFGNPASEKTEVKICYDDKAIYIGAFMYESHPEKINFQMTERDGQGNVDNIAIGLDTYDDNLNAFRFIISAAGVQSDGKMSPNDYDINWDAVWFAKTSEAKNGWIAEVKIPYSAIRFPSKPVQQWGLQFARNCVSVGEYVTWSPVDPNKAGSIAQWGSLTEIENIKPPLRLSFTPYLSVGYDAQPVSYDPVEYVTSKNINGGMDVKYGINEAFTLDATLIPDFGQVQSDNQILNLSPFETQYDENRQFFTEGTELFNQSVNLIQDGKMFYSRRIGGVPTGFYDVSSQLDSDEKIDKNPSTVQLYNATKLSGRTNKNLGIGYLNAITAPMYATVVNTETGEKRNIQTDVLTNYNVFVLDQTLKNNSHAGFYNTSVIREGSSSDANVSQLNFDLKNKKNSYSFSGFANYSTVQQNNEAHENQNGFYYGVALSKTSGMFQFDLANSIISPEYNQNDLGILYYNNEIANFAGLRLQSYKQKGKILNWSWWFGNNYKMRYKPASYVEYNFNTGIYTTFKNYWTMNFYIYSQPFNTNDYYEPRVDGMYFLQQPFVFSSASVSSDYRKKLVLSARLGFGESPRPNDPYYEFSLSPTWNATDKIRIIYDVFNSKDKKNYGFSHYDYNGLPILGSRDVWTVINTFKIQYTFNPRMSVSTRVRYYWSKVVYNEFFNLNTDGTLEPDEYETGWDENFNAFNLDFIYNWEFSPGSRLSVNWKNNIIQYDDKGADNYFENAAKTFDTPSGNNVSVRFMYYLDYQKLKRTKS